MKSVRVSVFTFAALLGGVAISAHAADCQTAEFSDSVLAKFPNIRQACLGVIQSGDEQRAVFKTKLVKVYPDDRVQVLIALPDGTYSKPRTIATSPDFRAVVNGKPVRVQQLPVDQEITAYIKVQEPAIALAPAEPTTPVVFSPLTAEQPSHVASAKMPRTGGNRFNLVWLGLALAITGNAVSLLLTYVSRRRLANFAAQD
jgi:hypothetical protein